MKNKYTIVAQNGTTEFDAEDVMVFHQKFTTVNAWNDLYAGYDYRVDPFDHIIAIHVYGKNTAGSPTCPLMFRTKNVGTGLFTAQSTIHNNKITTGADQLIGIVDINQLYRYSEAASLSVLPAADNFIQCMINAGASFTGYIYVNIYVKRNSR